MFKNIPEYGHKVLKPFVVGACCALLLTACQSPGGGVRSGLPDSQSGANVAKVLTPNPSGEVIGTGNVRISLLVPSTIPGGAAAVAKELRNGAELAIQDFGRNQVQLVVKDTKGQAAEAQARASEAISEGSSLVLGPLFAANVSAASGVTLPANVSMLAFSTDTSVARRGVYLFSYTPQSDTRRMISYAGSVNRKSMTAFLPRNAEGNLRGRILRQLAGSNGINLTIKEYDRTPEGIESMLSESAVSVQSSDSIYIPEGGPIPGLIVGGLRRLGVDTRSKQLFGSGAWEALEKGNPNLEGAIYPGRDVSRFKSFADRYAGKFGSQPGVQAALAYDAVTLASELYRLNGPAAFQPKNFESARGFQGTTGTFRLLQDGTTDRGLALYRIQSGRGTLFQPPIAGFSG